MQKNFVVKKSVSLSGNYDEKGKPKPDFLIRPGDVLVFDATNGNNLTVYRNEAIAIVMPHQSSIMIETLLKSGMLEEVKKSPTPAIPVPVVIPPPPVPVEEAKIETKTETKTEAKADVIPDPWDQKHTVKPLPQEKPKPQPKKPVKAEVVATGSTKDDTNKFEDTAL